MIDTGLIQIEGIERLIHDIGIGAISPCPHHGGRDVTRPRPHCDAETSRFDLRHAGSFISKKEITSQRFLRRSSKYGSQVYLTAEIPDKKFPPVLCFA